MVESLSLKKKIFIIAAALKVINNINEAFENTHHISLCCNYFLILFFKAFDIVDHNTLDGLQIASEILRLLNGILQGLV